MRNKVALLLVVVVAVFGVSVASADDICETLIDNLTPEGETRSEASCDLDGEMTGCVEIGTHEGSYAMACFENGIEV